MKYLIKSSEELHDIKAIINNASIIAVDTEFLREKTYNAKLCLLQLGIGQDQYCIDVLAIDDLSIISQMLQNLNVIKIFHAARQDMEVLYQTLGVLPKPIFDTQLASAFCGNDMQIGYAGIVEKVLDIQVPKSQARTDWTKRPLTDEQLEYAAADVKYLEQLYDIISQQLESDGRTAWFLQEIETYYQIEKYIVDPELAYQRLSGGALKLKQQAMLKALATWREATAQRTNIPRTWVVRDDGLYDIAIQRPQTLSELEKLNIFNPRSFNRYAESVIEITSIPPSITEPIWHYVRPLDKKQKSVCSDMMKIVREQAQSIKIAQGLLATRKDVEFLFRHQNSTKLLEGWREDLIGNDLLQHIQT